MYNAILVDDEIVAVTALHKRVAWSKYKIENVYIAKSMKQAMAIFQEHPIDIMLCDIEMPNGSGLDLFEWVKGFFPQVECIYVSCHPEFEYVRKAMKLGSFDYLLKPVDFTELDDLLKQIIKKIETLNEKENKKNSFSLKNSDLDNENETINDERIAQINKFIMENITSDICIDDIAEFVHLNPIYVMRLFKAKMDKSIIEYITDLRIDRAKELLVKTDQTIMKIADAVGYSNYSYFTRLFKKKIGLTPNKYRMANSNNK